MVGLVGLGIPQGPSLSPRFPCLEPAPVSSQLDAYATTQP